MFFKKKKAKAKFRKTKHNRISLAPLTHFRFKEPKKATKINKFTKSEVLDEFQNEILIEIQNGQKKELISLIKKSLLEINSISDLEKKQYLANMQNADIKILLRFYKKVNQALIAEKVFIDSLIS